LTGSGSNDKNDCAIIDTGHIRKIDLGIELPRSPLEAVMSGEAWGEVYDRLAELINEHRTTLVFVNTRRMAERVARHLAERVGEENITSHHGSLSRERRFIAEQRLKAGELRALVATASLELGIDIGAVDLVCQLGSTRSIATLLQRVGRSGHSVGGFPKGRLFPTSRDELVECAALIDAARRGELDHLVIPEKPKAKRAKKLFAFLARFALFVAVYYLFIRTPPKKTRGSPIRLSFPEAAVTGAGAGLMFKLPPLTLATRMEKASNASWAVTLTWP
jgi:ATP-dependent helicase Lhr and Lhr-like helicase